LLHFLNSQAQTSSFFIVAAYHLSFSEATHQKFKLDLNRNCYLEEPFEKQLELAELKKNTIAEYLITKPFDFIAFA